jgi:hypothetical protein
MNNIGGSAYLSGEVKRNAAVIGTRELSMRG